MVSKNCWVKKCLKFILKPAKVLERVNIYGVTQLKGSEKFDERSRMLGWLLL